MQLVAQRWASCNDLSAQQWPTGGSNNGPTLVTDSGPYEI